MLKKDNCITPSDSNQTPITYPSGGSSPTPNETDRRLDKLEKARSQDILARLHSIEEIDSIRRDGAAEIKRAVRQELDLGLSGPSVLTDVWSGLWNNFSELHAQVQGHAETLAIQRNHVLSLEQIGGEFEKLQAVQRDHFYSLESIANQIEQTPSAGLAARLTELERRFDNELTKLRARGEFVRRELLYEYRAALTATQQHQTPTKPTIINHNKVDQSLGANSLRVNLGCGHIALDEYVNIDRRELPGVDVVADVTNLPFEDDTIREIYSAHLLEHFPEEILLRTVLPHWLRKLQIGGVLRTIVPDAEAMIQDFTVGAMPFADLREVTFGGQGYIGDFHYTMFSRDHIKHILQDAGFSNLEFVMVGRKNGKCRELEIVGTRAI